VISCLEFRRRVGAEPSAPDEELAAHRRECAGCARYRDELRAMDGLIQRALQVNPRPVEAPAQAADAGAPRRRLYAIAATLVAGAALGLVLLVSVPRASVAREVMDHVTRETNTMASTQPLAPAALAEVLDPDGTRIRPGVGDVTFAARCLFDGRVVPHLVVRTSSGPVTVLMLRHRTIVKPIHLAEQGYEGVVLPAPKGSIAIVGQGVADIDSVARKVFDAIDWGR
jgi:Protein of unknown function (DUF3379)